ncbi:hypothetical protein J7399_11110 [Shimia sp. R9_1]|nr:hypothetical protein [Shimia sp. R9_1]MBO9407979.1 hypothetical protein [Shimia sp. R9_1]
MSVLSDAKIRALKSKASPIKRKVDLPFCYQGLWRFMVVVERLGYWF